MTQTLTTERLREIASSPSFSANPLSHEVKYMARELLANRAAQPVGRGNLTKIAAELVRGDYLNSLWHEAETSKRISTHRLQNLLDELHDVMKVKAIALTQVITAPPAPVVNPEFTGATAVPGYISTRQAIANMERHELCDSINVAYKHGWNDFRAAMLAQPVSQRYKLVPVEPTEEMIAAAMNCDDVEFNSDETFCVNFDNIYRAMLAAAPEGGNEK